MDSRGPKHFGALVEVVLDSPYGWSTGKNEAESSPESCPLNFGLSKVRTFGQNGPKKQGAVKGFPRPQTLLAIG